MFNFKKALILTLIHAPFSTSKPFELGLQSQALPDPSALRYAAQRDTVVYTTQVPRNFCYGSTLLRMCRWLSLSLARLRNCAPNLNVSAYIPHLKPPTPIMEFRLEEFFGT
jgi:hypothetical protein